MEDRGDHHTLRVPGEIAELLAFLNFILLLELNWGDIG